VNPGTPTVTQVTPNTGQQGQTGILLAITGQFTHFVQGTSTLSLGADITVNSVTVSSATSLNANITVPTSAATGNHTVTVTTGSEVATLSNGFIVQPGTPAITQVSPSSGQVSQSNLAVAITGQFTHFVQR